MALAALSKLDRANRRFGRLRWTCSEGDLNQDGVVNLVDNVILRRMLAGLPGAPSLEQQQE